MAEIKDMSENKIVPEINEKELMINVLQMLLKEDLLSEKVCENVVKKITRNGLLQ